MGPQISWCFVGGRENSFAFDWSLSGVGVSVWASLPPRHHGLVEIGRVGGILMVAVTVC